MTDAPRPSLDPAYFERIYAGDLDPWRFATSPYEAAKYDATLAALPRSRYVSGLEIGCSIGVLTERLADRCDSLLGIDVSEAALAQARTRCADLAGVRFARLAAPQEYPEGHFDLMVLSEVGYYWGRDDLLLARRQMLDHLSPGGHLLLVHWLGHAPDHPLSADEVHDLLMGGQAGDGAGLRWLGGQRTEEYRLDVLERL